jgi:hypothetical protein
MDSLFPTVFTERLLKLAEQLEAEVPSCTRRGLYALSDESLPVGRRRMSASTTVE